MTNKITIIIFCIHFTDSCTNILAKSEQKCNKKFRNSKQNIISIDNKIPGYPNKSTYHR